MNKKIQKVFKDHIEIVKSQMEGESEKVLIQIAQIVIEALDQGNKVILFGNGGSAADSQHLAAEFIGRFQKERRGLPAVALNVNTSNITALANDYSYDMIFERQIEALGVSGDVSIGFSTSGGSKNIIHAQKKAKETGLKTVAFIGSKKSPLESICDVVYKVPSENTARIQESHILAGHILCLLVEDALFDNEK